MDKVIGGAVFVVGDDVDTDQIIPARHLALNPAEPEERRYFGRYALSGLPPPGSGLPDGGIPFVEGEAFTSRFRVVLAGRNFGCGSSREHAPLALAEAGVRAVIAQSYARIFYRNSVNGAYLLPYETTRRLVEEFATGDEAEITTARPAVRNLRTGREFLLAPLGDATGIIQAGGIFPYARKRGMLE